MIIKLAYMDQDFEKNLNQPERRSYKAMKAGAMLGGALGIAGNLTTVNKDFKPNVGRVKRFFVKNNILPYNEKYYVSKRVPTIGRAARAGAIGVIAGGLLGLGLHRAKHTIQQLQDPK